MPHWIPCCQLDLKRNTISLSFLKISPFTAGLGFPLAAHNPSSTLNMTHLTLGGDHQTEILFFPHPLYCFPISNNIWNCDISKLLSCWRPVCYSWLSLPITTIKYFSLPVTNINYPRNHPPQNLTSSLEQPTSPWRVQWSRFHPSNSQIENMSVHYSLVAIKVDRYQDKNFGSEITKNGVPLYSTHSHKSTCIFNVADKTESAHACE